MSKTLTNYEQETIINFNKAEDVAYIFTYEKTWQKHLENGMKVYGAKILSYYPWVTF